MIAGKRLDQEPRGVWVHEFLLYTWGYRTDAQQAALVGQPVVLSRPRESTGLSAMLTAARAGGLDIPIGGESILFVDCEAAFYRTSVPRAVAQILQKAGYEFGLMGEQWCCGGPASGGRTRARAGRG